MGNLDGPTGIATRVDLYGYCVWFLDWRGATVPCMKAIELCSQLTNGMHCYDTELLIIILDVSATRGNSNNVLAGFSLPYAKRDLSSSKTPAMFERASSMNPDNRQARNFQCPKQEVTTKCTLRI